jgi:hypothetical protein
MMIRIESNLDRDNIVHPAFCSNPYKKVILNSVGDVSMCCHQLIQLGHLDATTEILELWRSPLAQEIRGESDQGRLHPVCGQGTACPYITQKRQMGPMEMCRRTSFPRVLEICLPDRHCNVGGENPSDGNPACIMCIRNFRKPEQADFTNFLCEKAKLLMPYLNQLCVLGIAEPFWKGALFRILEKLEFYRHKSNIQFFTNTNGICQTTRIAHRFFQEVVWSDLAWSLDAANRKTHMKIRRLDTFDTVVANLQGWITLREEYGGSDHHHVSIYNNINLLNVHEMTRMVEMASRLGVEKMTMLPTYDQAGVVDLGELVLGPKNVNIFKAAAIAARERAEELGVTLEYHKPFDIVPPPICLDGGST